MRPYEEANKGHYASLLKDDFSKYADAKFQVFPHGVYKDGDDPRQSRVWSIGYYSPRLRGIFSYFGGNDWHEFASIHDAYAGNCALSYGDFSVGRPLSNYPRSIRLSCRARIKDLSPFSSSSIAYQHGADVGKFHRDVADHLFNSLFRSSHFIGLDY